MMTMTNEPSRGESQTGPRPAIAVPLDGAGIRALAVRKPVPSAPSAPPSPGGAFSLCRLDNYGITSESPWSTAAIIGAGLAERARQWDIVEMLRTRRRMLSYQRAHAPRLAMGTCRTVPIPAAATGGCKGVNLWLSPSGFGWTGMMTCNGPWCLICSRRRIYERSARIVAGLSACTGKGGPSKAYFVTLTIPRSSDLAAQLVGIRDGWKKLQDVLDYQVRKKMKASYWTARALDVTFRPASKAIYHTHLHCIIMTDVVKPLAWIDGLVTGAWLSANGAAMKQCQKVEEVRHAGVGRYCAKLAGLGMELSSGLTKRGRGSMSFSQLVQAGMAGEFVDGEFVQGDYGRIHVNPVYVDFLKGMKGKRSMTFSRNWRWQAPEEEESESRPEGLALMAPYHWREAVLKRLDDLGKEAWKDQTMGRGAHLDDLRSLVEDMTPDELVGLDMDSELNTWLWTVKAEVYSEVAKIDTCHLRRE